MHVEVIGGQEEARLIFGAIRASVVLDPAPALCFDLGGGSLEVMVGDSGAMAWATSVPLGVARLSADHVHSDPISKTDRRALRDHVVEVLEPVAREVEPYEPKLAVGSSGTLESLAEMTAARRDEDTPATLNQLTITRQEFLSLHKDILASKAADRLRMRRPRRTPGRPHHRGLDGARHRHGGVRLRPAHDQRVGAPRRHRPRRGGSARSRRLVRRPARDPRQRGVGIGAPLQLGRGRTPARSPGSRSTCSTARPRCTGSTPPTASCSSTPRCCTTSVSTWRAAPTTSTART